MESKWYFFPGQTVENTNISDRAHALHITAPAWENITQHLNRKKRIQEALDKERAYKKALKNGSRKMTKEWHDSIENIRLRKNEERSKNLNQKNEDKIQQFYKMRAEQEAIRKEYVDKVKKNIYRSTDYPKQLTSALILSETLFEREKQKEFNKEIQKHKLEIKNKQDQEIIAKDEEQKKEDKEKALKKFEEQKKNVEIIKEQIRENAETRKALEKDKIKKDTEDCINAAKEEKLLKQYEFEENMRKRKEIAIERKKAIADERQRQEILIKENSEMEKATLFYSEAKHRIECMKKQKDKQLREDQIKKREELANEIKKMLEKSDLAEKERIAKSIIEKEEEEKQRAEAKAKSQAQALKEMQEDRIAYLKRLEEEKRVEDEIKRWEMLNRCKTAEVVKECDENNRREKWQKILEYRKILLEQMADDVAIRKKEKEIDDIMSHVSYEEADKMFFEYANEVLELAKNKKRSTYPIEKVILEYKKKHNMLPKNHHCRCCNKKHK